MRGGMIRLMTAWYLRCKKLNLIYKNTIPNSWHFKSKIRSYVHCWYECHCIRSFWKKIIFEIFSVTGFKLPFTPQTSLIAVKTYYYQTESNFPINGTNMAGKTLETFYNRENHDWSKY